MPYVITHLSSPIDCTAPGMSPNVNCGLWVVMTRRCRCIRCNQCAVWHRMLTMGEAVHVWDEGAYGNSLFSTPNCEPKTVQNEIYFGEISGPQAEVPGSSLGLSPGRWQFRVLRVGTWFLWSWFRGSSKAVSGSVSCSFFLPVARQVSYYHSLKRILFSSIKLPLLLCQSQLTEIWPDVGFTFFSFYVSW